MKLRNLLYANPPLPRVTGSIQVPNVFSHEMTCIIYVTPVGVYLSSKFKIFCKAFVPLKAGASPQLSSGTYSIFSNRKARCSHERSVGLNQSHKRLDWVHQSRSPHVSFHHDVPVLNVWHHVLAPPRSYKSNLSHHNSSFPVSELFCFPVETESQFRELEPSTLSPGTRALWDHLQLQKTLCFFYCVGRLLPWIIIICSCTLPLRDRKPKHANAGSLPEPPSLPLILRGWQALPFHPPSESAWHIYTILKSFKQDELHPSLNLCDTTNKWE